MNTATATATATATVVAEDAPLGVQLWPTRDDARYGDNFTLELVETIRTINGTVVRWTYRNGNVRIFDLGERVSVRFPA